MPYIKKERRRELDSGTDFPDSPAELSYVLFKLFRQYVAEHGEGYITFSEIFGVLETLKHELYRRWVAPYEKRKIEENGDVE